MYIYVYIHISICHWYEWILILRMIMHPYLNEHNNKRRCMTLNIYFWWSEGKDAEDFKLSEMRCLNRSNSIHSLYTIQGIQSLYRLLFSNVCAVSVQLNKQFHLLKQTCHLHSNLQNNLLNCLNWMTKQNTSNMFQATFLGLELPLTSLKAGRDHFIENPCNSKTKDQCIELFYCENPFLWDFYLNPFLDLWVLGEL